MISPPKAGSKRRLADQHPVTLTLIVFVDGPHTTQMHKWVSGYDREEPMPVKTKLAKITQLFEGQLICKQLEQGRAPLGSEWMVLGENATANIVGDVITNTRLGATLQLLATKIANKMNNKMDIPVGHILELTSTQINGLDLSDVRSDTVLKYGSIYYQAIRTDDQGGPTVGDDSCRTTIKSKEKLLAKYLERHCEIYSPGNCAISGPFKTYSAPVQGEAEVYCEEPQQTALSCSSTPPSRRNPRHVPRTKNLDTCERLFAPSSLSLSLFRSLIPPRALCASDLML